MSRLISEPKTRVAMISVFAALFLTIIKLAVGLLTNSLGILAEALHSGLDLVAAGITFIAVYYASKPADELHPFGHGKIENFSALIETLILIITCGWIIFEAFDRLNNQEVHVEVNILSFLVIIVAIIVDFVVSQLLFKVANETNSQALKADALHFSTDILSSAVVLVGLIFVSIGFPIGDAIAALIVAGIVMWISSKLGLTTINSLLDKVPSVEYSQLMNLLNQEYAEYKIIRLRLRESGPLIQGDLTIELPEKMKLNQIMSLKEDITFKIRSLIQNSDITILATTKNSTTNLGLKKETQMNWYDIINSIDIASNLTTEVHNISFYSINMDSYVDLHLLLPNNLHLNEAHELSLNFEKKVYKLIPDLKKVFIHIEPLEIDFPNRILIPNNEEIRIAINSVTSNYREVKDIKDIKASMFNEKITVQATILLEPNIELMEAHTITEEIEKSLHNKFSNLKRISVYTLPFNG
ncbi:MAG: cation diffusion facilitator family transporter [Candidatus Hodarchaeales archaeon]|jgi:cation diffusion facilitator family transporter